MSPAREEFLSILFHAPGLEQCLTHVSYNYFLSESGPLLKVPSHNSFVIFSLDSSIGLELSGRLPGSFDLCCLVPWCLEDHTIEVSRYLERRQMVSGSNSATTLKILFT